MNPKDPLGAVFDRTSLLSAPEQLVTLITNPRSNPTAALLLLAIIAAAVLVVLIVVIMWINSLPDEDELNADPDVSSAVDTRTQRETLTSEPLPPRPALPLVLGLCASGFVLLAVLVATGYTTSPDSVCVSCHEKTVHDEAQTERLHAKTECVECHEPGGVIGRYALSVPGRLVHFVDGVRSDSVLGSYGAVTSSSCAECHSVNVRGVTVNADSGVRMSHVEPLAAGAICTDCHKLSAGDVGRHNAGMNPCIRCHDSKLASAECDTCHDKKASAAAQARSTSFRAVQVSPVRCGGCHDEKRECDGCHGGIRLPHTNDFIGMAHARAGAVNFWYEDGRLCVKCHTATRRPCTKCHTSQLLGVGHQPSMAVDHRAATASGCDLCHSRNATVGNRDFCIDLCHNPAAIAESPR